MKTTRELKYKIWTGSIMMQPKSLLIMHQETVNGVTVGHWEKLIYLQYTGLKDKDGLGDELYHKDLIVNLSRNDGKPHIVEWSDTLGGWVGLYRGLEYLIAQELREIQKVGNVYETPELLNRD